MTLHDPTNVGSPRISRLATRLADREYRQNYLSSHLRGFLATQIRAMRGDRTQKEFGDLIGKPQSVVSRLEDENYGALTLQTLLDIANRLDIALLVRFVDYPTFVVLTNDISTSTLAPRPYQVGRPSAGSPAITSTLSSTAVHTTDTTIVPHVTIRELDHAG